MDPDATLAALEEAESADELFELVHGLVEWLEREGFAPDWEQYPHGTAIVLALVGDKGVAAWFRETYIEVQADDA